MKTRLTAAAVALLAAAIIAGCGSSKQGARIPTSQANQLISLLNETKRRAGTKIDGACHDIQNHDLPQLNSQLNSLPGNIDSNIKSTLTNGISHLNDLVNTQCSALDQQQTQPTTPKTQPTTTQTTPPPTTTAPPPTTTQTQTTHTTPPPTHTTPPPVTAPPGPGNGGVPGNNAGPGKGNGNGGENGNGKGKGNG